MSHFFRFRFLDLWIKLGKIIEKVRGWTESGAKLYVAPWQQKIYSRLLLNKKLVPANKIIKYVNNKWGEWANLAASYIWEDIFWQRKQGKKIDWLEKEIRL